MPDKVPDTLEELIDALDFLGVFMYVLVLKEYPTTMEELLQLLVEVTAIEVSDQRDILDLPAVKQLAVLARLLVKYGVIDPDSLPSDLKLEEELAFQTLLPFG